jgi:hypothetical protein
MHVEVAAAKISPDEAEHVCVYVQASLQKFKEALEDAKKVWIATDWHLFGLPFRLAHSNSGWNYVQGCRSILTPSLPVCCSKVVELKPEWPKGYSRLGAAHVGLKDWDGAIAAYGKGSNVARPLSHTIELATDSFT